jgi:starch phosphorylase
VAPAFYERTDGVPPRWVELVRHTLTTLRPQVQATRMVREYVEDWYAPAARAAERIASDGYAPAKELAAFRRRLDAAWPSVAVTGVDASGLPDTPVVGAPMTVRAVVALAGLDPADVAVEAVVGRVHDTDELGDTVTVPMKHVGPVDGVEGADAGGAAPSGRPGGLERFEAVVQLPHAGLTGYTVRVLPANPLLASPAELGKVVLAG